MNNLLHSKAPLMVVLRLLLVILVVFMGVLRLRIIFILLDSPESYIDRDLLTYYLMAKAFLAHLDPYLPLNELSLRFVGAASDLAHPAPCTPVMILFFVPFSLFSLGSSVVIWFLVEILILGGIAYMLPILWNGRRSLRGTILIFLLMLAWYPVMVDLLYGQLTILLTAMLLAALLALRKNNNILAGILIGISVAIKMYTWPVMLFFAVKKDWRAFFSSCITLAGLNLVALLVIGVDPVFNYYLKITDQVSAIYHSYLQNYSVWSIGYRLFEGTRPVGGNFISAPALINAPGLAPVASAALAGLILILGLVGVIKSKNLEHAYSIIICVLIIISPITWDHYYFMAIIPIVVSLHVLSKHSFPTWPTILSIVIIFMLFYVNEQIGSIVILLNNSELLQSNGNRISFGSSLIEILPMLELIILAVLLRQRGLQKEKPNITS